MAAFDHAPAVLLKPHPLAPLEAVEFPACLLFGLVFAGTLEFSFGFSQRLHGPRSLVLLLPRRLKVALSVLVHVGVKVQQHVWALCFVVLVGQDDRDGSVGGSGANDPRDSFDGFADGAPSVPLHGLVGLVEQPLHVVPVRLYEVPERLLFLDFLREALKRLLLLGLASFKFLDLRGLASSGSRLLKPLFLPTLEGVRVMDTLPDIDGLAK